MDAVNSAIESNRPESANRHADTTCRPTPTHSTRVSLLLLVCMLCFTSRLVCGIAELIRCGTAGWNRLSTVNSAPHTRHREMGAEELTQFKVGRGEGYACVESAG